MSFSSFSASKALRWSSNTKVKLPKCRESALSKMGYPVKVHRWIGRLVSRNWMLSSRKPITKNSRNRYSRHSYSNHKHTNKQTLNPLLVDYSTCLLFPMVLTPKRRISENGCSGKRRKG